MAPATLDVLPDAELVVARPEVRDRLEAASTALAAAVLGLDGWELADVAPEVLRLVDSALAALDREAA